MPSDSNEGKSDGAPASERRSARVATAWGPARNALAAVHNLEALLRNRQVANATLFELLAELRASAATLREAFARAQEGQEAAAGLGLHGFREVDGLAELLDAIASAGHSRDELANRAGLFADELEASVDLLALLDRAGSPLSTEVSLDLLAREAGRTSTSARGRELRVRFDEAVPDRVVMTDPSVVGHLISLSVASVHAQTPSEPIVLRARSTPHAHFLVQSSDSTEAALPPLSIHVMVWAAPSERAARRVAELIGARLDLTDGTACLTLDGGGVRAVG